MFVIIFIRFNIRIFRWRFSLLIWMKEWESFRSVYNSFVCIRLESFIGRFFMFGVFEVQTVVLTNGSLRRRRKVRAKLN